MLYIIDDISSGTKYCHYTGKEVAAQILSSETFFMSRLDMMNDLGESHIHEEESKQIFVASFCHSESFNIPMFYLYSGIDGKGCRIQFTDAKMKNILNHNSIYPVNKAGKKMKKPFSEEEYDIYAGEVNYIASSGFGYYRDKKVKYESFEEALEVLAAENKQYLIKNPIWKYEQEFRIVVRFKKPIEYTRIAMSFDISDNESGISVLLGPENDGEEIALVAEKYKDYGICKVKGVLDRQLSMGLINKNKVFLGR